MDKEDLMNVIFKHSKDLAGMLDDVTKNILYNKDLIVLNEKHKKSNYNIEEEIEKLKIQEETIKKIIDYFETTMDDDDVDIKEIEKELQ